MNLDPQHSELCLTPNMPIRLLSARGVRIVCTAGVLWLTVEGEAGDIVLRAGESHVVRGSGLALLEAIGRGQVRFERVAPPMRLRFARLLGGLRQWSAGERRPLPTLRAC
ncbi:MAG: DUF2917 domain-containing protein [Candidatus Accumulibacter sp. UW20]|jgi:hypothetical protein